MQLYHKRDKYIARKDFFTTQMKELSRRTSKMILGMLGMLPYDGYYVHKNMTTILNLDWDDTTHQVHANTVIDPETGRTRVRLTITVTGFNITLNMSVLFAVHSLGHPSFAYIPVSWDIKLFDGSDERSINELPVHESLILVILRALAIQRGISLAIENDYIGDTFIEEAKDYGMPDSTEKLFVRFGAEYFRNLMENAIRPHIAQMQQACNDN